MFVTEQEARDRTAAAVPRETLLALERYAAALERAAPVQNLVSRETLEHIWSRHILDCVQLRPLVAGTVIDIGTGAGLPGLILAIMGLSVTLAEPRKLRASFLSQCIIELGLSSVTLHVGSSASLRSQYPTITARAVAPLTKLLEMTMHLALPTSRWVLPKGRNAHAELEVARRAWHGRFELIPSITDPSAMIIVADQIRPRASR